MRDNLAALLLFGALVLGLPSRNAAAEDSLFDQQTLTGNWGGLRKTLKDAGIDLGINDTSEMLSNPVGGIKQTTIHEGLLTLTLNLDLEKLANWPGATIYSEAYQIRGRGLSRSALGNLLAVSNIEALPSARLNDLWLQQEMLDRQISLRVGQIAINRSADRRAVLSVRGTGRAAARRADRRSDIVRCSLKRKSGAPRTRRPAGPQFRRNELPDRRGWGAGTRGACLFV